MASIQTSIYINIVKELNTVFDIKYTHHPDPSGNL